MLLQRLDRYWSIFLSSTITDFARFLLCAHCNWMKTHCFVTARCCKWLICHVAILFIYQRYVKPEMSDLHFEHRVERDVRGRGRGILAWTFALEVWEKLHESSYFEVMGQGIRLRFRTQDRSACCVYRIHRSCLCSNFILFFSYELFIVQKLTMLSVAVIM
jgi:hypothetical protein